MPCKNVGTPKCSGLQAGTVGLQAENFNPVAVGVVYKVESHVVVLVANAAHFLVEGTYGIVVARYAHADVKFVLAQIVRLGVVAQPSEFQFEIARFVLEINNFESTFRNPPEQKTCPATQTR